MASTGVIPATTVSHSSFSMASAVNFIDASIGTIKAANLSIGDAATAWRLPTTPAAVG